MPSKRHISAWMAPSEGNSGIRSFNQGELLVGQGDFLDRQLVGRCDGTDRDPLLGQSPPEEQRVEVESPDLVIVVIGICRVFVAVAQQGRQHRVTAPSREHTDSFEDRGLPDGVVSGEQRHPAEPADRELPDSPKPGDGQGREMKAAPGCFPNHEISSDAGIGSGKKLPLVTYGSNSDGPLSAPCPPVPRQGALAAPNP